MMIAVLAGDGIGQEIVPQALKMPEPLDLGVELVEAANVLGRPSVPGRPMRRVMKMISD